jgi:hypothetical protein
MERFVTRHGDRIVGILSGFDRMLFRGTLRSISYVEGLDKFLSSQHVLYKDFAAYVQRLSEGLKTHAIGIAADAGRPYEYVTSAAVRKDDRAREIAARDGITEGLVCVLTCVEPCRSFTIRRDREAQRLRLVAGERKCLHVYVYLLDPDFGLMHVRLQTWLPFTIQICLNGRAWLAACLRRAGVAFTQVDNCFTRIADVARAQALADDLIDWPWERWLRRWGHWVNPYVRPPDGVLYDYYWSVRQSEYATDLMFRNAKAVEVLYPALLRHGIETFHSEDVLRFLGQRPSTGFTRQVHSDLQRRVEGVRIKHWVDENSIKMYDKAGSLIRIETTINNPDRFKVRRRRRSDGHLDWLPLRKGIADIRRRAAISRAANARYVDALSVVGETTPSHRLLDPVSQRVTYNRRVYRALRPISPQEAPVLQTIFRGEFRLQGFSNRDLRTALAAPSTDPAGHRRESSRMTRQLRLLRAHGLIKKVPRTHRYRITRNGEAVISTAIRFRETNFALLAA